MAGEGSRPWAGDHSDGGRALWTDEEDAPMPTLTIDLPPEVEQQLREEAAGQGLDVTGYVTRLLLDRRFAEHLRIVLGDLQGPQFELLRERLRLSQFSALSEALDRLRIYPPSPEEEAQHGGSHLRGAVGDDLDRAEITTRPSVEAIRKVIESAGQQRDGQRTQNRAAIALLDRWSTEDAAKGDTAGPPPEIEPLRLREVDRG